MNNDLISRSALKEKIHKSILSSNREWLLMDLDKIIDNAPAASDHYNEGYAQGYIDGMTGVDMKGDAE